MVKMAPGWQEYGWFRRGVAIGLAALGVLVSVLPAPPPVQAAGSAQWEWRHPRPQGNGLNGIAYGQGAFVAVGENGTLLHSTDGEVWTPRPSRTARPLQAVTHGPDGFVAVGKGGTVRVSEDGREWHSVPRVTDSDLMGIAYGAGQYVAVGSWGTVRISRDGRNWDYGRTGTQQPLLAVTYGNGRFVAVGTEGLVLTSPDGREWTRRDIPVAWRPWLYAVTHGGDRFVAVGGDGVMLTSSDATTWTRSPGEADNPLSAVAFGHGRYVAMGLWGPAYASADGKAWSPVDKGTQARMNALVYGGGRFVAVGEGGTIVSSADGTRWTLATGGTWQALHRVVYGRDRFVAVGQGGVVATSGDGTAWTWHSAGEHYDLVDVAYHQGQFVAVGALNEFTVERRNNPPAISTLDGVILTSPDGRTWTRRYPELEPPAYTHAPGKAIVGIAYGADRFVAVRRDGTVLLSGDGANWDGTTWQAADTNSTEPVQDVAFGNGLFMAVGAAGTVLVSTDGRDWLKLVAAYRPSFAGVAYGSGWFAAITDFSVFRSRDGRDWELVYNAHGHGLQAIHAVGDRLVALDSVGGLHISHDGTPGTWGEVQTGSSYPLRGYAVGAGVRVAVGEHGSLLSWPESTCGQRFADVPGAHPACPSIEKLAGRGIIAGDGDGRFRPTNAITRAEFAKLLVLAMGAEPAPDQSLPFTDVAGHWSATQGYLQTATARGWVRGYPNGHFYPDERIRRSELVTMVAAAAGLQPDDQGGQTSGAPGPADQDGQGPDGWPPYGDVLPSHWFAGWVNGAYRAGLIGPGAAVAVWDEGDFNAWAAPTRAEAAMVLDNLLIAREG